MKQFLALAVVAFLAGYQSSRAHDLWLIPPSKIEAGKKTPIQARIGMDFPKSVSAPDTAKFKRNFVFDPEGKESTLAPADKGILDFEPKQNGIHILAVETNPKVITLDADAFNAYLVADGMPHIYLLRAKENILNQPAKERYSKHVKTLVQVGQEGGGDPRQVLGMTLEIVPLRDPLKAKIGDALPVRVLFQKKELPDANLGWQHPGDGESARGYIRTDAKGEALIPIARPGLMTIRLTHMTRPKTKEYEWESFWSTLTFHVPE